MYGLYPGDKQHKNKANYKRGLKINVNRTKTFGKRGPNFYIKRILKHRKKYRGKKGIHRGLFSKSMFGTTRYRWEWLYIKNNGQYLNFKRKQKKYVTKTTRRKDNKLWTKRLIELRQFRHDLRFKRVTRARRWNKRFYRESWKKKRN